MPKKAAELGPLAVSRLKTPGTHAIGGVAGLKLKINDAGGRSWILRVRLGGKRRDMGLGGYPDVTLAQAREKAREARDKIDTGTDPIRERQEAQSALSAKSAKAKTFNECVDAYIDAKSGEWRNAKHKAQWRSTLDTYAAKVLGPMLVSHIDVAQVVDVLSPIWVLKTETASRLRGRMEQILSWATTMGYRKGDNPARWRGHLDQLLAKPRRIKKVKHHPAVPVRSAAKFVEALRNVEGQSARALEFALLTAARSGEVRSARWAEIDNETGEWVIPAARMKAKREHKVPLSKQAIELLKALPRYETTDLIFPGAKEDTPLSDMSLTACMRRLGFKDAQGDVCVPHGCRSTFRDWVADVTHYPADMAEMALAHTIDSAVEAAYRRGDMLEKRRQMMQDWADYCEQLVPRKNLFELVNGEVRSRRAA